MGILFITIVVNSTFLVRNLLLSSFAFTAISSCMMVLSLSLVTTACSLVCCIWFTIALFKKLCTVFFCLFVCFFFHYLCLCIEIAERMVVIQWGSVDRLTVRKICNFFIKYMFFSSCFMFCDVCYWCFIWLLLYLCGSAIYVHWPECWFRLNMRSMKPWLVS